MPTEPPEYGIAQQDHLRRALQQLRLATEGGQPEAYFYSALELRFAIEQTVQTYLQLIHSDVWSNKLEKMYAPRDMRARILKSEPQFYEKLKFTSLCMTAIGLPEAYPIDLDEIDRLYGRIGGYLHAQARVDKTVANPDWWLTLRGILEEAASYLTEIISRAMGHMPFDPEQSEPYKKWLLGEITDEEIQIQFRESVPAEDLQRLHEFIKRQRG